MIELRWIKRNGEKILQARVVPCNIAESTCGDMIIEPQGPISLRMEDNWTEWEDVSLVEEVSE